MGLFSWVCCKSNLPVMNDMVAPPEQSRVVVLMKHGEKIVGSYDGYGRVDGEDVADDMVCNRARMVLEKFYDASDAFDSLSENQPEPGQGHFLDADFVDTIYAKGGFKSYDEYFEAYNRMGQNWRLGMRDRDHGES
jgi:hypothetical protein